MILNIRNVRLDLNDVSRYHPHIYEVSPKKYYSLYYYVKGVKEAQSIGMSSEEEMNSIVEFMDKSLGVIKLEFTPEKEVTKAKLEISKM